MTQTATLTGTEVRVTGQTETTTLQHQSATKVDSKTGTESRKVDRKLSLAYRLSQSEEIFWDATFGQMMAASSPWQ